MRESIVKNVWWVAFILAIFLLITHSLKLFEINVDSTSILLLVLILISPYVNSFTKIKYGDFEAEITHDEVQKIKTESLDSVSNSNIEYDPSNEIYETIKSIRELSENDHIIALAKLRIELEKTLKRYVRLSLSKVKSSSISTMISDLQNSEIITVKKAKSLREITSICNRALHGEHISIESAKTIIDVGTQMMDDIYWEIELGSASGNIVSEEEIEPFDYETLFYEKKYRLTSIVPLVEIPRKIVRELTQEQLDNLLDGYNEYAEFIISLEEVVKDG